MRQAESLTVDLPSRPDTNTDLMAASRVASDLARDLIAAARMNASPNGDTVGRGNKVNKEELLGMMAAVEAYVKRDHAAEWKEWERRLNIVATAAKSIP